MINLHLPLVLVPERSSGRVVCGIVGCALSKLSFPQHVTFVQALCQRVTPWIV
jgi:hypothetical protein